MSGFVGPSPLIPTGTTGNVTGASATLSPAAADICVLFVSEVTGTTITLAIQGTLDLSGVADGSANWFPIVVKSTADDTATSTIAAITTGGAKPFWLSAAPDRFCRRIRAVTSANTGFTYRVELHQQYGN